MTLWIGLTGGIGSGKSSIAQMFAELGVPIIDADAISRSLTAKNGEALPAIRQLFGDEVFDSKGRLNRTALREEVFRRPLRFIHYCFWLQPFGLIIFRFNRLIYRI